MTPGADAGVVSSGAVTVGEVMGKNDNVSDDAFTAGGLGGVVARRNKIILTLNI